MDSITKIKKKAWSMLIVMLVSVLVSQLAETAGGAMQWLQSAGEEEEAPRHILLDAGHGGKDPGATASITIEKDLNLAIALKLQQYLEMAGYMVSMTRTIDEGLYSEGDTNKKRADMAERKRLMEESGADLLVSIHQNSFPDPQYWGPQVFYQQGNTESETLALQVQANLNEFTAPGNTRQAKSNNSYYILLQAPMPGILVECGFITNSRESESLRSESYQKKVAWGIFAGIQRYFDSIDEMVYNQQ